METSGAPSRNVPIAAMRWPRTSPARILEASSFMHAIVVSSRGPSVLGQVIFRENAVRYELLVGLRYTRAKRRNHFISFISLISMLGIALGVAALIVVLSVMNGFQKELRARILGVVSHVQITGPGGQLADWQNVMDEALKDPRVLAAAPFVNAQAMLSSGPEARGALVQ